MHSRAVLFISLFAFAFLVVIGSVALRLTSASAATGEAVADHAGSLPEGTDAAGGASSNLSFFRDTSRSDASGDGNSTLTTLEASSADSLEILLRQVHVMFEPEGSGVSNAMIPYLAEMITIINQFDHLVYRIDIVEPDASLARRRAQTLNDVLRLNVLEPSKLRIVGRQGLHAALVEVSAS